MTTGVRDVFCDAMLVRIRAMRTALRYERSQLGDDRCWIDLGPIFAAAGIIADFRKLPPWAEMERRCAGFFDFSQRPGDPRPIRSDAIIDPAHWDDDLATHGADRSWLGEQERVLLEYIRRLYGKWWRGTPLTHEDYDRVYMLLPEKLYADTRLPPHDEFLGRAKSPCAGCPAFWESHQGCAPDKDCDVHVWGDKCPARVPAATA